MLGNKPLIAEKKGYDYFNAQGNVNAIQLYVQFSCNMHEKLQGSVCVSGGDSYLLCWHMETQESMNRKHVASMSTTNLMQQIVLECGQVTLYIIIWVWWWRFGCLVAWFCNAFPCWFGNEHAQIGSPGSPSPLTGLRLWQDPVTGGWPGVVYGCVLLSPCDHARLLVVLSIYYLLYCNYDCALVMMNILKTYGWDVPQKLVSFLAEILLPWSPFVNIVHSCSKVIGLDARAPDILPAKHCAQPSEAVRHFEEELWQHWYGDSYKANCFPWCLVGTNISSTYCWAYRFF